MMDDKDKISLEVAELFFLSFDGGIGEEQFARLEALLLNNPFAREHYYYLLQTVVELEETEEILHVERSDSLVGNFDTFLWKALAEDEKTAPAIAIVKPTPQREPVKMLKVEKSPRVINKSSLCTVIVSIAALVFVLIYVSLAPTPASSVAMITDSLNAQWVQSDHQTDIGGRLWDNEGARWLLKGTVKIEFDYGAEVIIEGPSEFELESADEMILHSGRLYVTIPKRATGFIVQTPSSTVIDLGTEFGLEINNIGSTNVYMFKGKASLIPGQNGDKGESHILVAGQAKAVTLSGQVREIELKKQAFVRKFDSKTGFLWRGEDEISLADVVGGGNGFGTGRPQRGVDPGAGETRTYGRHRERVYLTAANTYLPYEPHSFIDGVFVPSSSPNPQVVSSMGHTFSDCPKTNGEYFEGIINGGGLKGIGEKRALLLNGVDYGTRENPGIFMHANQGITFDLQAMRMSLGGGRLLRFSSICGIPGTSEDTNYGLVDIYVLVDGQLRFAQQKVRNEKAYEIDIVFNEQDRFLTLVTVTNENKVHPENKYLHYGDWAMFGNPVIAYEN